MMKNSLFCIFFDWFCSFLDVCGCGLWWFGYEWGLSAGGFQSICCCFCSRVFKSYFTWDCTGDYLRLYLRCLWYLRETILEILFGFFVWNHVSIYLSIYLYYIACDCTKRFTVILKSNTKTMHEIHWCTAVACKTHLKNRRKFFQDRWIRIYIYICMEFTLGPTWCKRSIWTYRLDLHKYRWSHKKNLHWILTLRSHCKAFTFAKQNLDIFFGKWNLVKSQRLKKIVHGNWRHACFKTQFERKLIDSSGTFLSHQKNWRRSGWNPCKPLAGLKGYSQEVLVRPNLLNSGMLATNLDQIT